MVKLKVVVCSVVAVFVVLVGTVHTLSRAANTAHARDVATLQSRLGESIAAYASLQAKFDRRPAPVSAPCPPPAVGAVRLRTVPTRREPFIFANMDIDGQKTTYKVSRPDLVDFLQTQQGANK